MSDTPTLAEWLAIPREALAEQIRPRTLTAMLCVDGTRRHYLLANDCIQTDIEDFDDFSRHTAHAYVAVYDMLFALGVRNVLTSLLYPPNFKRTEAYVRNAVRASERLLLTEPFLGLYKRWHIRARLYGDYDVAPLPPSIQTALGALDQGLADLTPDGDTGLLFGYSAGSFTTEQIARTVALTQQLGRPPTEAELRAAVYPGLDGIDLYISAGWMRVDQTLPPLLSRNTDLYFLSYLALDLSEDHLRRILYDHLFLRNAAPEDNAQYSTDQLAEMGRFYAAHQTVTGLGQVIGPGLWYAEQT